MMWGACSSCDKRQSMIKYVFCVYRKKRYPLYATVYVQKKCFVKDVMYASITIHVQHRIIQKYGITEFHCKSIEIKMWL